MNNFKVKDKVRLVNYVKKLTYLKKNFAYPAGKIMYEDNNKWICDLEPERLGNSGIIDKIDKKNNKYFILFTGYEEWFNKEQIEKI